MLAMLKEEKKKARGPLQAVRGFCCKDPLPADHEVIRPVSCNADGRKQKRLLPVICFEQFSVIYVGT